MRYRTIYDREALATLEQVGEARPLAAAGEQSRVYDGLPLKLVIADRSIGLVPFMLPTELFEMLWDRASPESAYRTTLLRDLLGVRLPGGHVHTPVLDMDPANRTDITDPVFEKNRTDIGTQVELILRLGTATLA